MGKGSGQRRPFSLGGSELIVAIDDDAYLDLEPEIRRVLTRAPLPIQIVRASTLADPDAEADLHFGRYSPTTPDCQLILEYIAASRTPVPVRSIALAHSCGLQRRSKPRA
jgi:hypothetical protein